MAETSSSGTNTDTENKIKELMDVEYTYPSPNDPEFQSKIYNKREFYYHKISGRSELTEYKDIKEYRDEICTRKFTLQEQQSFLSNFINPFTPYKGVLVFHGTGTGKCIYGDSLVKINNRTTLKIKDIWDRLATEIVHSGPNNLEEWAKPAEYFSVNSFYNNKFINGPVVRLFREYIDHSMKHITLEDGRSIKITNIHKLLTPNGWTNILSEGDRVCLYNGVYSKIVSIDIFHHKGYVYDLEVDTYHNYVANGVLCHNTCAGITIAEKFKPVVQKYGTKIFVLTSGPLIQENWKSELLKCTGETYLKEHDATVYRTDAEKEKAEKIAINNAFQYYRFISYKGFYKRVLGERIKVKNETTGKREKYRKTEDGVLERDISIDKITSLDNTLIIVDEAHNLTGNNFGEALTKVIKKSKNLKVVLLTATPMKNLADDIIELLNFLRPRNSPIIRDKIFNRNPTYTMGLQPGGLEYLKKMATGYVSYLRGADPLTFAKRIEKGVVPEGLVFTKVIRCKMEPFQRKAYDKAVEKEGDTLDRHSTAVANFAFPGLDGEKIVGYHGIEGIEKVKNQVRSNPELINNKIAKNILKTSADPDNIIKVSDDGRTVSGDILKMENIKNFSVKFYKVLKKIRRLVWGKKGAKTAFLYSNLVRVGIEILAETLKQNGYLEYEEDMANYKIKQNTLCYFCGHTYEKHQQDILKEASQLKRSTKISESSTEYEKQRGSPPSHKFYPATFVLVTGKVADESADVIPEDKQKILNRVFSNIDNREGKYIKFVLGSRVMNEGISLRNVAEVHILDVSFNLGRVDQVIGRAIRHCSHYGITNDKNRFPKVDVYKYVVSLENGLSSEEELYKKAEQKYLLIKKVERALKESAIDCPLNRDGNIFPEEVSKYKNCVDPSKAKSGQIACPAMCDYTDCEFKCDDKTLNKLYWDDKEKVYKKVPKNKIDYSTFNKSLAQNEIEKIKIKIKDMYRIQYVYTLKDIVDFVKNTYEGEKRELFDDFFVFKALDELTPITENDFNNFRDTVFDKYNRPGYIIYIDRYYIYQPFDQPVDVPMYYRTTYNRPMTQQLTLYSYLKNSTKFKEHAKIDKVVDRKVKDIIDPTLDEYDFDSTMDYYNSRPEFKIVGIIDKESGRKKDKRLETLKDTFKIREKRKKVTDKKRGIGIQSFKGSVCNNSKSRDYLEKIAKLLKIVFKPGKESRVTLCQAIMNRLLILEKYATRKKGDKVTYIMVPANHSKYPFPYNLEDRARSIIDKIKDRIKIKLDISLKQSKQKVGDKEYPMFTITVKNVKGLEEFKKYFQDLGGELKKEGWTFILK